MNRLFKEGWFEIEGISINYLINTKGKILNAATGKIHPSSLNKEGLYQSKLLDRDGFVVIRPIHRLTALTFVKRPPELSGVPFDELSVVHIDGNRLNNEAFNLEWTSFKRAVSLSRANGTFSNEKSVVAKNLLTNDLVKFKSLTEAARWAGVFPSELSRHLHSEVAGRIVHQGHVFSFDAPELIWPEWTFPESSHLKIGRVADVVVTKCDGGGTLIFNSIAEAARMLNLDLQELNRHFRKNGHGIPFNRLLFDSLKNFLQSDTS